MREDEPKRAKRADDVAGSDVDPFAVIEQAVAWVFVCFCGVLMVRVRRDAGNASTWNFLQAHEQTLDMTMLGFAMVCGVIVATVGNSSKHRGGIIAAVKSAMAVRPPRERRRRDDLDD